MITVQGVRKSYRGPDGPLPVLDGIDARVERGEFAAVRGSSGCGKSTLLLILGGLLRPDGGRVLVGGEDVYGMGAEARAAWRARRVGFVFQRFHLLPYLTVEENIRAAAVGLGGGGAGGAARVRELMDRFGLGPRAGHLPGKLSVGEQQRTAMARALFNKPEVILADEPTGNLDPENGGAVLDSLAAFVREGGTVVMVTHHPDAAARAGKVWTLRGGRLGE